MNDYHSRIESKYKSRWCKTIIEDAVASHPVVVITGARQVGKSTFLQHEKPFRDWHYISLDDLDILKQAQTEPLSIWGKTDAIVIDEAQKAPSLLHFIKQTVDKNRGKTRFALSGSANLLLMKQVSESLAGRAVYFIMLPMTLGEIENKEPPKWFFNLLKGRLPDTKTISSVKNPISYLLKGFMPPVLTLPSERSVLQWWEGYVVTYLERDLRQISQIDSLPDFHRVMKAIALRSGQLINQTEISRDTTVSQPTVYRYISLLETMCLLDRLPAFTKNRTSRLIKSPKIYWIDPGLVSFLSGYHDIQSLTRAKEAGGIFETLCFLHLKALSHLLIPRGALFYWRTVTGKEVDFILEHGRKLIAFEAKLSSSPGFKDTEGLRSFIKEYPETNAGILIHTGHKVIYFDEKIIALPWQMLAMDC